MPNPPDPYHIPPLYVNGHHTSDSSPKEFFEPNEDFNNPFNPHEPFYSDYNSQNHTNPPPDFSNDSIQQLSPSQLRERFRDRYPSSPTPGYRLGVDDDPMAIIPPLPDLETNSTQTLDLNHVSDTLTPHVNGLLSTALELRLPRATRSTSAFHVFHNAENSGLASRIGFFNRTILRCLVERYKILSLMLLSAAHLLAHRKQALVIGLNLPLPIHTTQSGLLVFQGVGWFMRRKGLQARRPILM